MESTGNIFDPAYFILDEADGVVYRKEQFKEGGELPLEVIVRDRRYRKKEITSALSAVGLNIEWCRCVRAGHWDADYDETDSQAKEILVLCSKPRH